MSETYTGIEWENGPSGKTPISAKNLNIMNQGIVDAHKLIKELKESGVGGVTDEQLENTINAYFVKNPIQTVSDIFMRVSDGYIQFSTDNSTWENVIAVSDISGDDGKTAYEYAQDGGYTGTEEEFAQKLAKEIKVDSELSEESENPVQNKVVAQKFSQLSDTVNDLKGSEVSGISVELTSALVNYYTHVMPNFDDTNGLSYINAILTALGAETRGENGSGGEEPEVPTDKTLASISATYAGGDVTSGTALTDLTGITVTATYSDGSIANVTGYTLSGDILVGENTITVSYGGKTTTFTVTGVAEETDPLYGTYWPPAPIYANINSNEYYTYTGNSGEYIDAGLPSANAVRLNDKLEGTVYIRTLTSNQYGTLPNTYTLYANDDGEIATGGFSEVKPTITRSLGTMVVNDKTYYFVLFKFEIPSGKKGLFVSAMSSMQSEYFISTDKNNIDEEYKQYYTLFTSDPTDRITEGATEVNV